MKNTNSRLESPVESVDRALTLLTMLQTGEILSVKVAAARLDVAPSTAHRLLGALIARNYAVRDQDRRYRIGPALSSDTSTPYSLTTLRKAAKAPMIKCQSGVGETMHLVRLRAKDVHFIDGIESERSLRVALRVGARMPAYCSAGGKALLATLSNTSVSALYGSQLPPWPTRQITTVRRLLSHLADVRVRGYGTNQEETEVGVCGIGVAIAETGERAIAAVTFAVPSARFDPKYESDLSRTLFSCAQAIRDNLAASP